ILDLRNGITKPRIQIDAALSALASGESYTSGSTVTLTATPRAGFQFKSWSGCDSAVGNQCTVKMNRAASVTANFDPVSSTPDLLLTSVNGSQSVVAGGEISLSAELRNQSPAPAGAFRLGFYLSSDAQITVSDQLFARCEFTFGLPGNTTTTCSGPA